MSAAALLARLAVAALGHLLGDPGDLQRMAAGRVQALDGRDLLAGGLGHRRLARAHGLTVEVHRARPALRDAAAELRAGQLEPLADHPQERRARIDVNRLRLPVDQQYRHDASCVGGKPTISWREPSTKSPPPATPAAARWCRRRVTGARLGVRPSRGTACPGVEEKTLGMNASI